MVTIDGNINLWASQFPQNQVSNILKLVLDSWKTFNPPDVLLEVPITKRFYSHLLANQDRSIHFFQINWEPYLVEDGETVGRLDLKFIQGWNVKVYFSLECKLLRVTRPSNQFESLAGKYVTEGMYRYFNGQYASNLDKGGMLGYVMDGQTGEAIQDVRHAIHNRRCKLRMSEQGTLRPSSMVSSHQVRETEHNYGPKGKFILYHIFLPVSA